MRGPTAPISASASWSDSMLASSTTSTSVPGIGSSGPRSKPSPGTQPSRRWIVVACAPVDSARRRAALPVGAQSLTVRLLAFTQVDERAHRRGLPGAGPAGEDRQPAGEHRVDDRPLVVGRHERARRRSLDAGELQRRAAVDELAHPARETALDAVHRRIGEQVAVGDEQPARDELVEAIRDVRPEQGARAPGELLAGEQAVAVLAGLLERVQHPGVEALRRLRVGSQRARQRVRRREPDALDLRGGVRVLAQHVDGLRAERALDARGGGTRDAVLGEEQPQRAAPADLLPRAHRRADPRRADPRDLAQAGPRLAVDQLEHAGPVTIEQPLGTAGPDVLDAGEHVQQRRVARRAQAPRLLDLEPPAVLGVAAPGAVRFERLALVDVVERAGQGDLVALVGERRDDGEAALRSAPAHGHHLRAQRAR